MNELSGQDVKVTKLLDRLESKGIISEVQKMQLLEKTPKYVPEEQVNTYILSQIAFLGSPGILSQLKSNVDTVANDSLKKGDDTSKLSADLIELGLVTKDIVLEWQATIQQHQQPDSKEMMLMFYAFKASKKLEGQKQNQHAINLISKYINENVLDSLFLKKYNSGEIKISHPIDLIHHAPLGMVLKLNEFPKDISAGYSKIYAGLNGIFDDLEIKLLEINTTLDTLQKPNYLVAKIKLEINQEHYTHTFNYNFIGNKNTLENVMVTSFNPQLIQPINQALIKSDNPYRLYYINSNNAGYQHDNIGLIFLTKNQYYLLKENKKSSNITGPNPIVPMSSSIIKTLVSEAKSIGLIPENSTIPKDSSIQNFADIFYVYNLVFKRRFHVSATENYSQILNEYASIIGSEFDLNIHKEDWDFENNKVNLSFSLNGKTEKMSLSIDKNRIDQIFLKWLPSTLSSITFSKKLVSMGDGATDIGIGYFSNEQIKWIKKHSDFWISE